MAKLQYLPHGNEPAGYVPPIVDLHDRWLVPPRLAPPDAPEAAMVLQPGQFIDLHEIRDRHFLEWARSHHDFKVVNSSPHPEAALWNR
jgi:hypothetical protein